MRMLQQRFKFAFVLFGATLGLSGLGVAQGPAADQGVPPTIVAAAESLKTLEAQIRMTWTAAGTKKSSEGSVRLMRPNFAEIRLTGDYPERLLVLTGQRRYEVNDKNVYKQTEAQRGGADADDPWWGMPFRFFFTQNTNPFGAVPDPKASFEVLPSKRADGLVTVVRHGTAPMAYTAMLTFDPRGVLERSEVDFGDPAQGGASFTAELSGIRLNQAMAPSLFAFRAPTGAVAETTAPEDALLAVGSTVKDFTLQGPDGRGVSSAAERSAGKVLLVNFWYLNCPPCRLEFPELEKLYGRFHGQGLGMIAVDKGDSAAQVSAYVRKAGLTMPIALGGPEDKGSVFELYKISSFPVTYLIDTEGKVLYRVATGDVGGLEKRLAELGFR